MWCFFFFVVVRGEPGWWPPLREKKRIRPLILGPEDSVDSCLSDSAGGLLAIGLSGGEGLEEKKLKFPERVIRVKVGLLGDLTWGLIGSREVQSRKNIAAARNGTIPSLIALAYIVRL